MLNPELPRRSTGLPGPVRYCGGAHSKLTLRSQLLQINKTHILGGSNCTQPFRSYSGSVAEAPTNNGNSSVCVAGRHEGGWSNRTTVDCGGGWSGRYTPGLWGYRARFKPSHVPPPGECPLILSVQPGASLFAARYLEK